MALTHTPAPQLGAKAHDFSLKGVDGKIWTPDFFGYNAKGELQFRGRLDEVNPSKSARGLKSRRLLWGAILNGKVLARLKEL